MKTTNLNRLAAVAAGLFLTAYGSSSGQSLSQSLTLMLEYEPELAAAGSDLDASRREIGIARSERLPSLTISGSTGYATRDRSLDAVVSGAGETLLSRQIGLSVQQLLFDFGAARTRTHVAKHNARAREMLTNGMIESRAVDLAEVYLEVLRARDQIAEAEKNIATHDVIAEKLRERVANGQSEADLALVVGRIGLAKTSLDTQRLSLELAERAVSNFLLVSPLKP